MSTRGKNERGASAVEYGLMVVGAGLAIVAGLFMISASLAVLFGAHCANLSGGPC